jgi:isocitrate/isopropylmalate dehydrogenase
MLEYLGEPAAAQRIAKAVADFQQDARSLSTTDVTDELLRRL